MSAAVSDGKRSWRGTPRGVVVRRSRNLWRVILSALAVAFIVAAVYLAWPRRESQLALLVLTAEREERTAPLVPYVAGDRQALVAWAENAGIAVSERPLAELGTGAAIRTWLSVAPEAQNRLTFTRTKRSGNYQLAKNDRLLIYVKAHGIALDAANANQPDVRPLLIKSLNEADLESEWYQGEKNVIDVSSLLEELAKQPDLQVVLVLDVVHLNFDPRLGMVINAFPEALRRIAEKIADPGRLSIVVAQGDGELSVAMPSEGRSAFVESFVKALERQPRDKSAIAAADAFARLQAQLEQLNRGGRGSFRQTLQRVPLAGNDRLPATFLLPTHLPIEPAEGSKPQPAAAAAEAVKSEAQRAIPGATEAANVAKAASNLQGAAGTPDKAANAAATDSSNKGKGTADGEAVASKGASQPTAASGADAPSSTGSLPAGGVAASPAQPEGTLPTVLETAWSARDRLQARRTTGWSPVHVAPRHWRRVEALLAGFDEELLPADQKPRDPRTLEDLARDLEKLDAIFAGQREQPRGADCLAIAEALDPFLAGPAKSFHSRQPQALDAANAAVKVFAEGFYRAYDLVRLHGQSAALADAKTLLDDTALETYIGQLGELRRLLSPLGLEDGRLDEMRLRDVVRLAADVERSLQRLNDDITAYVHSTNAAPPSPGAALRARILLHSPLIPAPLRRDLRRQREVAKPVDQATPAAAPVIFGPRLATNVKLMARLRQIALPPDQQSTFQRDNLYAALQGADPKADILAWAVVGKRLRQLGERERAVPGAGSSPPAAASTSDLQPFDWYLQDLLVDARDAHRVSAASQNLVALVQPLRAPRVGDAVDVKFSRQQLRLPSPGTDGTTVQLTLNVTADKPPPYDVKLDLAWDARDVIVTRQGNGAALQRGTNELRLANEQETIELNIRAERVSTSDAVTAISGAARFGIAAAKGELACLMPRPDLIELTVASEGSTSTVSQRSWLPSGEQGGRLKLFPNRENGLSLHLTNLSSEDKRVHARLYRVPRSAVDSSGRLFDPRSPTQLVMAADELHRKLAQAGAEMQLLPRRELLAQSNEKEPLELKAGSGAVKVPLSAIGAAQPSPPPTPGAAPVDTAKDVTAGLLLVLASADGKGKPTAKWIELQIHQPDDLFEVREPALRDGRLTFRTGLKNVRGAGQETTLADEMGIGMKPVTVVWDTQPLPAELRPTKREDLLADGQGEAELSAQAGADVAWPVFLHLHTDGYPRGLVSRLSWRGSVANLENLKVNHAPVVQITRAGATAQRANATAEKVQFLSRPERAWMPFPAAQIAAAGIRVRRSGEPLLVRVDENRPTVQIDCDLAADIAPRYFNDEARLRISVDGQVREFASDRQIAVRLTGIEDSNLRLANQVSDFEGVVFEPGEVLQDRRIELAAEVTGSGNLDGPGGAPRDMVMIVLDRTRPRTNELSGQKLPAAPVGAAGGPPPTVVSLRCQASDGVGSGIAKVEFVVGFDVISNNGRLDEAERRPPVMAIRMAEGVYEAEYAIEGPPPSDALLVEAIATDNVGLTSEPIAGRIPLPRSTAGGQRTTFGSKKVDGEDPPEKKRK